RIDVEATEHPAQILCVVCVLARFVPQLADVFIRQPAEVRAVVVGAVPRQVAVAVPVVVAIAAVVAAVSAAAIRAACLLATLLAAALLIPSLLATLTLLATLALLARLTLLTGLALLAFLPLLPLLALLVAALLLTTLTLLPVLLTALLVLSVLRALTRALLQRLEASRQTLSPIERLLRLRGSILLLPLAERGCRFIEPLLQLVDAAGDVVLRRAQRLLAVAAVHQRLGVPDLVAKPVVTDRAGRLRQLA